LALCASLAAGSVFEKLGHSRVLAPAVNYTLSWTPNALKSGQVRICVQAIATPTEFIALGFSEDNKMMNHSDIVVAYMGTDGKPVVKTMFADEFPAGGGYPGGVSTLTIKDATLVAENGMLQACFERALSSGHYPLEDGGRVIWSIGPLVDGNISYHGKDAHDDTGKSQVHRSDECNPINWITGENACTSVEYCCPAAEHCLEASELTCTDHCPGGQTCCPLTKLCVTPGAPCITPCSDLGSYCCPDAKHCLTPTNPGHICTGPGTQGSCASGEVCCPLIKECVSVGASCIAP